MRFSSILSRSARVAICDAASYALIAASCATDGALAKGSGPSTLEVLQDTWAESQTTYYVILKINRTLSLPVELTQGSICLPLFVEAWKWCGANIYIMMNGWPVQPGTKVSDFPIGNNTVFTVHFRLRGGAENYTEEQKDKPAARYTAKINQDWLDFESKQYLQTEAFSQRLQKQVRKRSRKEIQAEEYTVDFQEEIKKLVDPEVLSLVEDLSLLCMQMVRASTHTDRVLALTCFYKARAGTSVVLGVAGIVSNIAKELLGPELQADEKDTLSKITDFRDLLDQWERLQESTLVQKFLKAYKFAIAVGAFSLIGIKIDKHTVAACKKEANFGLTGPNFIVSILDAISLLIQRGLMFLKTGRWETFFHGPMSYGKWYDKCQKVRRESNFVGNLEAVDTNYHTFTSDVAEVIEEGEAILRFGKQTTGVEAKAIKTLLNDMKMIQATLFTYNEAQRSRRPAFSLLVCSGSSLAKSTFVDMIYKFMGQVWKLEATDAFKYTRNSAEPFWSGWNSSKWFILLDDIAYINPNSPVQDMSLTEMISLVNDVPLVPNQAALEDRGKNPVRARAVIATTNVKHLNAHAHFSCPLAVQRRLPFVVNLRPKPEYARTDSPQMIDPMKLPPIVDDWPDYWLITVERDLS